MGNILLVPYLILREQREDKAEAERMNRKRLCKIPVEKFCFVFFLSFSSSFFFLF